MVETDAISLEPDQAQNLQDLFDSENDRELLLRRGADDAEDIPVAVKRLLVAEANPADGNGHGRAGIVFDVLEKRKYCRSSSSVIKSGDL